MDRLLELAIVGAWIWLSVLALTRAFSERRRWQARAQTPLCATQPARQCSVQV
jgi:hypothetical protein